MAQEKTIEQLLRLSRNQYYILTESETKRLNDFLAENTDDSSKNSRKKNSKQSDKQTPVRVKNVVEKTGSDTPETTSNES